MSNEHCGERHPEQDVTCRLPQGRHADHLAGFGPDLVSWPADPATYQRNRVGKHQITDVALRVMKGPSPSGRGEHQRKG